MILILNEEKSTLNHRMGTPIEKQRDIAKVSLGAELGRGRRGWLRVHVVVTRRRGNAEVLAVGGLAKASCVLAEVLVLPVLVLAEAVAGEAPPTTARPAAAHAPSVAAAVVAVETRPRTAEAVLFVGRVVVPPRA